MKKSKNISYIICSPDLNGCPPLSFITSLFDCSYLAVSDLTERIFLPDGEVHVHPLHPLCVGVIKYKVLEKRRKDHSGFLRTLAL